MIDKDTLNEAYKVANDLHAVFDLETFAGFLSYCRQISDNWTTSQAEWEKENPHSFFIPKEVYNKAALKSLRVITKMAHYFGPLLVEIDKQYGLRFDEMCEKLEAKPPIPPWVNHK